MAVVAVEVCESYSIRVKGGCESEGNGGGWGGVGEVIGARNTQVFIEDHLIVDGAV